MMQRTTTSVPSDAFPPQNEAAEARVLGALLIIGSMEVGDPDAAATTMANRIIALLRPSDFSRQWHRRVYLAILRARRASAGAGYQDICRALREQGQAPALEDSDLVGLMEAPVTIAYTLDDAAAVHDTAIRRELLRLSGAIASLAYDTDAAQAIAQAQQRLTLLAARCAVSVPESVTTNGLKRQSVEIPV